MNQKIKFRKEGHHKITIGSDLDVPTVVIWFESINKVVDSDIKSEPYAVALAEHIARELELYVNLNRGDKDENNNIDWEKAVREMETG